ncbi:MAG: PAS domain-containing protein [Alphaproteobacteria bacterium]|nr:PAS domain-containing protein [Alphaproteobacteria bacterium]
MQLKDDIQTRECRIFADAWQRWRGDDLVPRRSSIRIEEISKLLHLVSVIEVISTDMAKFRLAGTALCEAMGIELTGLNYFDFTTVEERGPRVARTCQLVSQPCGSHFLFPIMYRSGRVVPTEVVSFPVLPDEPDAPPQLFALSMALEEMRLEGPAAQPRQLPLAEGFQFIDIGAGIPDDALDLGEREVAKLHRFVS